MEKEFTELTSATIKQIAQYEERLSCLLQRYFDISKIDNYVKSLEEFRGEYSQFVEKLTPELLRTIDQRKIERLTNRIQALHQYWLHIGRFYSNAKILNLQCLTEINLPEYTEFIEQFEQCQKQFQEWFTA